MLIETLTIWLLLDTGGYTGLVGYNVFAQVGPTILPILCGFSVWRLRGEKHLSTKWATKGRLRSIGGIGDKRY